ncbi:hypothetical protein ACVRXQ_03065 [Streptococcus panodentis]|uniref:DUF2140 family protein n=1 Tax=Streptococcus panodentis TaxID=1581472 RepID=A0ABS5B1Y7_9STRE|nr:hypothetical protein [Streptococcus panodentis]MBP2621979.1 hypothetical protein [Streptococcus panodentis]
MKMVKRLVGIAVLLFIAAVVFLVPSSVNQSEQLKNVQGSASWMSIIEPTLSNANLTAQGVNTEVSLNSVQLNQVLKSFLADSQNQELLDSAYSIDGNKLRIQYPVRLAFVDSKLDLEVDVTVADNVLHVNVDSAKLGAFPIPKSLVTGLLRQQLEKSDSSVRTEGDSFLFSLPETQFSIKKINFQNGTAKIQFTMGYGF